MSLRARAAHNSRCRQVPRPSVRRPRAEVPLRQRAPQPDPEDRLHVCVPGPGQGGRSRVRADAPKHEPAFTPAELRS